jgi:hypothetical protein
MAAPRDRRHLTIDRDPHSEEYSPHPRDLSSIARKAPEDRPGRGRALKRSFEEAVAAAHLRREQAPHRMIRYEQSRPLSALVFPANCLGGGVGVCREEEAFFGRADCHSVKTG